MSDKSHSGRSGGRLVKRKPAPFALEARMMFDGAALATATTVVDKPVDTSIVDTSTTKSDTSSASAATDTTTAATTERTVDTGATGATTTQQEIVFIDTSVPNWQTLAQDVRPGAQIILLDPSKDGLAQIAAALDGRSGIDAIHIISHGAQGTLILGGQSYTADTLSQRQAELATIGHALTDNGDILLYGCDVGEGSAGQQLIQTVADLTHADVAASTNATGAADLGADWTLEAKSGTIDSALFADPSTLGNYEARLSSISLTGNSGWIPVMVGTNFDPQGDSQAGAADTDIVGDATHAALYVAFDDGGTPGVSSDDYMYFRLRIDNPTSSTNFGGVAIIGVDANLDGRVDLFFAVDGRNNTQAVRLLDPGTGLNNSPSTTTTTPLPSGWLPNNGLYPFSTSNYAVTAVSAGSDPNWNGVTDLGGDGKTDVFVSFKVPLADVATVLAVPSPTDRSGVTGPRGATGIAGFGASTVVRYVLMTQTQPGPINGDLSGVGANYDKNATFDQLGSFTAPMSVSDPIPAGSSLTIIEPIGDGNLSASEDGSVTISGSSSNLADGTNLTLTISDSDGTTADVVTTATVSGNSWSASGVNLSSLADGTLTVTAQTSAGATVIDTATVSHDRTAPAIAITNGTAYNDTTPTLSGSSDLPAGSVITVTVDPDNDSGTNNSLTYITTVLSGGAWVIDTGVVAPTAGSLPASGLPSYAKITATGTDAAGNTTTTVALNRPTVNSLTTNDTTPVLTGTWTSLAGDSLTVEVDGTIYSTSNGLIVTGNTWSLTPNTLALGTYDVLATVTRSGGGTAVDAVTGELIVVSGPAVTITGGATASDADTTPSISGTTTLSAGDFVLVRIDPNNDGNLADAVTYAVTVGTGGAWSVDTGSATPISGSFPAAGITGGAGIVVTATDADGNVASASQTLTVTVPSIAIGSIETTTTSNSSATVITGDDIFNMREDDAVTVSGTSANAAGQTVTVTVSDGTTNVTGSATVASNGNWSATGMNLSSLKDGTLTVTAAVLTVSDSDVVTHDATAPLMYITTASTIDKTNPVLKGITDLAAGSTITVTVTKTSDGSAVASGTTTVGTDGRWTWQNASNVIYPTGTNAVTITVSSSGTDVAGNKLANVSKQQTVANNITPPTVTIVSMTGTDYAASPIDSTITSAEITGGVTISGTSSTTSGTIGVSVTDGTTTLNFTPTTNGNWSVSLTEAQVKAFKNGTLTVTASVTASSITAYSMRVPSLLLVTGTPTISVHSPIDNGVLNGSEDDSVSISGTTTNAVGSTVTLTVSDSNGATADVVGTGVVANDGSWTVTGLNLSSLAEGQLNVSASVTANSTTASGSASVAHDTTAPAIAITSGASATDTTPIISGTSDLPAGSTLTITIDPNNDGVSSDQIVYTVTVQSNGTWSVNTETATPTSGALGSGLTGYAKITASGSDQAGNTTTVTALNVPTVDAQTTNDTTPTLTGIWTNLVGDSLSVSVNGTTYTTLNGLVISGNTWSLTTPVLTAATYDVTTTVTRGGSTVSDASSGELVLDTTAPTIAIGSATSTADTTPVISGTTDLPQGAVLTLVIDPDNDPATTDSVTYSVIVGAGGSWSVDIGSALPTNGSLPSGGLVGSIGVAVSGTDSAGNATTATQTLVIDDVPPVLAISSNAKTPDPTPVIAGTTDLPAGSSVTLQIDPNNDGDYSDAYTYTLTVQAGGVWSVDTGAVAPDGGGSTVSLSGTVGLRVSGSDSLGNSASATKALTIDLSAPALSIATPVGDGVLSASEDDAVTIQGTTSDIADNSTLAVSITDGSKTIVDTVTVSGNAWSMTPIDLSSLGDGTITITTTYVDDQGNSYSDTTTFVHDKTPPTVALSAASTTISGPVTVTATFAESVTGLTASDFAASNGGAVSNLLQLDATTWTFTLTPAVDGTTSVWLAASGVQDTAGNDNAISSALSFTVNTVAPDTIAPTLVSIARDTPSANLTNASNVTFRVSFSEDVSGVDTADFTATGAGASGATVQSVSAVSGQAGAYDVTVSGIAANNGTLGLALASAPSVSDTAGNVLTDPTPSASESYSLDHVAPQLLASGGATVAYSSLVLSYDEALAGSTPATGDFTVTNNGSSITVTGVSVNTTANTVTVTLNQAVVAGDVVAISYTPGTNATRDLAGNTAAGFTAVAVTNTMPLPDTTAPAAPTLSLRSSSDSGVSNSDAITNDDTPTVRVALNGSGATAPVAGDVVKIFNGATQVASVALSSSDISAGYVDITTSTLGSDGTKGLTATVTDSASNISSASTALDLTLDRTACAVASASANGTTLTLTYDETLGSVSPAAGDFTVKINGGTVSVSSVSLDTAAKTVTLTLASAVSAGDAVTVSYTPGTNPIQDVAGNAASALSDSTVTNATGDTTAPAAPALSLRPGSDSGESASDAITNDTTPTVRVALNGSGATAPVAGDVVKIYSGATQVGSATLSSGDISAGYIDITTSTLGSDGAKSLTATVTDGANNTSGVSSALALTLDTSACSLTAADITADTLTLTYDETLGSATPAVGDFTVSVNSVAVSVSSIAVDTSAKTVTLTLASAVDVGDTVSVSYTPGSNAIQDVAGNAAVSLSGRSVTNHTTDTTPPTLTSIDDGDADDRVTAGDTLSYTVTFSEDIDASTVAASDFVNAGSAGISIGTITETSPGVFRVDVTTTSAGSLQLQIPAGAVIKDAAGNALDTSGAIADDTTVTVLPTLASPTVGTLSTSDSMPALAGTWGGSNGGNDTLTVTVDGITYTTSSGLVVGANTWSLTIPSAHALSIGAHDVTATVARAGGASRSDTSTNEITVLASSTTSSNALPLPVNESAVSRSLSPTPTPAPMSLETAMPVETTNDAFRSQLGLSGALDPLRSADRKSLMFDLDTARLGARAERPFEHILTSPGEQAFRIVVAKSEQPALFVFRGMRDQDGEADASFGFKVPVDAFVHTDPHAVIVLRATLADGRALPAWLHFDPQTGKFSGKPPHGASEKLAIVVIARDNEGREASTLFHLKVTATHGPRDGGRAGLSEQIRTAAHRDRHLDRYAALKRRH